MHVIAFPYAKQAVCSQFQVAKQLLLHKNVANSAIETLQLKIVGCFDGLINEGNFYRILFPHRW
jgi:hypothetical protein